jgi:hypothetical protein
MSPVKQRKISQREFERTIAKFESRESARGQLYPMALKLRQAAFEVEADLLILATWNFAGFRYVMRTFDLQHFRDAIETTKPHFHRLESHTFQAADFDSIAEDVTVIYDAFKSVAKQTGASKIIHLRHPKLFVMWDTDIRKNYGFRNRSSAQDYIDFQKSMQSAFGHLAWSRDDKTLPKAIDEYNYLTAHPE